MKANSWINTTGDGRFAVHYYCETTDDRVTLSDEHVDSEWVRPEKTEQMLCEAQIAAVHTATAETEATSEITDRSSLAHD